MSKKKWLLGIGLFVLVLMTALACKAVSLVEPTATPSPTATATPVPTDTPLPPSPTPQPAAVVPTLPLAPTQSSTGTGILNPNAVSSGDVLYSEAFNDLSNWTTILMRGNQNGFRSQVFDNRLRTEIETQNTWVYYILESEDLQDVRVDVQVENRGSNTNFVGILCRYSEQTWYEVNILNSGYFYVYYFYDSGAHLNTMYKGATYAINMGKKINNYTVICRGELLSVIINGEEIVSLPLRTGDYPFLSSGKVGLSVSAERVIPVLIDFLEFVLRVP